LARAAIPWSVRVPVLRELRLLVERHEVELRRLVTVAVQTGARTQDIADALGVSRSTLWRHYRSELLRSGVSESSAERLARRVPAGAARSRR
jgi:transcriptional regulator of acetoin/glycerol metabolism